MTNQVFSQILIYLTDFSSFIKKFTGDVGNPGVPAEALAKAGVHYDWLIIFFFIFVILIVALSLGKSRMLLALLSLYAASFLETNFLYFDKLRGLFSAIGGSASGRKNLPDYWLHIGLFLLIYVVVFAIMNRSFLKHRLTLAETSIFAVVLVAIVEMGFLATILISYFPNELLQKIPPKLLTYFATKNAHFWWAVVPVLALLFSKKKKETKQPV